MKTPANFTLNVTGAGGDSLRAFAREVLGPAGHDLADEYRDELEEKDETIADLQKVTARLAGLLTERTEQLLEAAAEAGATAPPPVILVPSIVRTAIADLKRELEAARECATNQLRDAAEVADRADAALKSIAEAFGIKEIGPVDTLARRLRLIVANERQEATSLRADAAEAKVKELEDKLAENVLERQLMWDVIDEVAQITGVLEDGELDARWQELPTLIQESLERESAELRDAMAAVQERAKAPTLAAHLGPDVMDALAEAQGYDGFDDDQIKVDIVDVVKRLKAAEEERDELIQHAGEPAADPNPPAPIAAVPIEARESSGTKPAPVPVWQGLGWPPGVSRAEYIAWKEEQKALGVTEHIHPQEYKRLADAGLLDPTKYRTTPTVVPAELAAAAPETAQRKRRTKEEIEAERAARPQIEVGQVWRATATKGDRRVTRIYEDDRGAWVDYDAMTKTTTRPANCSLDRFYEWIAKSGAELEDQAIAAAIHGRAATEPTPAATANAEESPLQRILELNDWLTSRHKGNFLERLNRSPEEHQAESAQWQEVMSELRELRASIEPDLAELAPDRWEAIFGAGSPASRSHGFHPGPKGPLQFKTGQNYEAALVTWAGAHTLYDGTKCLGVVGEDGKGHFHVFDGKGNHIGWAKGITAAFETIVTAKPTKQAKAGDGAPAPKASGKLPERDLKAIEAATARVKRGDYEPGDGRMIFGDVRQKALQIRFLLSNVGVEGPVEREALLCEFLPDGVWDDKAQLDTEVIAQAAAAWRRAREERGVKAPPGHVPGQKSLPIEGNSEADIPALAENRVDPYAGESPLRYITGREREYAEAMLDRADITGKERENFLYETFGRTILGTLTLAQYQRLIWDLLPPIVNEKLGHGALTAAPIGDDFGDLEVPAAVGAGA